MATPTFHEIQAAMTGFPRTLAWTNFRSVKTSPSPPHEAMTSASFSSTGWRVTLVKGEYRITGARVNVDINTGASFATASAQTSTDLLTHEQGHFDITGLIARDIISQILSLSYDESVVAVVRGVGNSSQARINWVTQEFQKDVNRIGREAKAALDRLQTDPVTGVDGIYDTQTNHSQNTTAQAVWNTRFQQAKITNTNFQLDLKLAGIL
ncbi:MAG: hypothetical protein IPL59_22035 [Candidatus Competibacteraceae bacterium]|uniref:DUF922 domain-containing protein n=1 Tax=Candidatus Contendobacter odensis Run_B_J11 TaxID=1400861 RepID=A0A7U7J3Z7_9GAMM|nr:hypothetical protein [Candidatus Contendobacter odensis]MBK8537540.1 hypothetical protein [Candidatus Competibacteraceae bacterium]MBK8751471.1 hypothetical protein [Candidatus Competibacteraceae bacterium]CDH46716.1 hypothetical protein BN874_570004 [Candidatus Contendobacter odensis Run_B_J11]